MGLPGVNSPFHITVPSWLVRTDLRPEKHKSALSVPKYVKVSLLMEVAGQAFDKLFQVCTCEGYTSSGIHCSHPLGDWRAFLVRTLQCLVCRCAGSTPPLSCLTLQPVHGTACVKALKSHLCPQLSHLIKDILASHETHIHLTLFWSGLSPSCLSPDASSCQCLSGSRTHLTWQGPRKCRHRALATPRLHLSFSFLSCTIQKGMLYSLTLLNFHGCCQSQKVQ